MTVGITYVDGPRLARSLYAAADWVAAGREEINRINVFPVPDGDTGTNFSLTRFRRPPAPWPEPPCSAPGVTPA